MACSPATPKAREPSDAQPASAAGPSQDSVLFALVQLTRDSAGTVSASVSVNPPVPGKAKASLLGAPTDNEGEVEAAILDAGGNALTAAWFPDPLTVIAEDVAPNGDLSGRPVQLHEATLLARLPKQAAGATLVVFRHQNAKMQELARQLLH